MKKYITVILSFITLTAFSQKKQSKADQFFEQMHYKDAANEYEKNYKNGVKTLSLKQRAGDSYYFNANMDEAAKWYDLLFEEHKTDSIESIYAFRFIHSLQGSGKYDEAKKMIGFFEDKGMVNPLQVEHLNGGSVQRFRELMALKPSFKVFNQNGVNSPYSDFGPMFYKNDIVFASARDTMDLETREYHWNKQPFLDLYISQKTLNREKFFKDIEAESEKYSFLKLTNSIKFSKELNTRYHEASVAFTPDEKVIYFTRNNFKVTDKRNLKRGNDGINHLKLYKANYIWDAKAKDSIWSNIVELPFNNESYSVGHPSVSKDGRTLYFASDMPGGFGATDIYKVQINEDGSYGDPENLGNNVNTAGREMYPYVTASRLYYASDGQLGLGGLDVFESVYDENLGYSVSKNLGAPLNSMMDDFGFIIDEEKQIGYFSSNRKGGIGDDDIYSFIKIVETAPNKIVDVCEQTVTGKVINSINKKNIPKAKVELFNSDKELVETLETDDAGVFSFSSVLDCEKLYFVKGSKESYKEDNLMLETGKELTQTLNLNLELEPIIDLIYIDKGIKKFRIENLNFDLNKDNIRPDAAAELNKIISVMIEYPSIVIKIEAHTDSRGSDAYNEKLSDKRAKSTRNYLLNNGINPNRIESAIGYGEKRLLNECGNGVKCSNEKHDINRRSDFIITKM